MSNASSVAPDPSAAPAPDPSAVAGVAATLQSVSVVAAAAGASYAADAASQAALLASAIVPQAPGVASAAAQAAAAAAKALTDAADAADDSLAAPGVSAALNAAADRTTAAASSLRAIERDTAPREEKAGTWASAASRVAGDEDGVIVARGSRAGRMREAGEDGGGRMVRTLPRFRLVVLPYNIDHYGPGLRSLVLQNVCVCDSNAFREALPTFVRKSRELERALNDDESAVIAGMIALGLQL